MGFADPLIALPLPRDDLPRLAAPPPRAALGARRRRLARRQALARPCRPPAGPPRPRRRALDPPRRKACACPSAAAALRCREAPRLRRRAAAALLRVLVPGQLLLHPHQQEGPHRQRWQLWLPDDHLDDAARRRRRLRPPLLAHPPPRPPQGHFFRSDQHAPRCLLRRRRALLLRLRAIGRRRLLRHDREGGGACLRGGARHLSLRQDRLQGQVALPHPRDRRRHPRVGQGVGLRVVGADHRLPRQPLRRLQGQREQEADGDARDQGPAGVCGQSVRPHDHPRLPHLHSVHGCQGVEQVGRLRDGVQVDACGVQQPHRLGAALLHVQRAGHHDDQEDLRHHPVGRQHRQARHRHRRLRDRLRGEREADEDARLHHRHRWCLPLLDGQVEGVFLSPAAARRE